MREAGAAFVSSTVCKSHQQTYRQKEHMGTLKDTIHPHPRFLHNLICNYVKACVLSGGSFLKSLSWRQKGKAACAKHRQGLSNSTHACNMTALCKPKSKRPKALPSCTRICNSSQVTPRSLGHGVHYPECQCREMRCSCLREALDQHFHRQQNLQKTLSCDISSHLLWIQVS